MLAFVQSRTERMWIAALVAFPVLMFAAGASLLWASRGGRYGPAAEIALLMCAYIVAFAGLTWIRNQPEPPVIVAPPDPHAVIKPTRAVAPQTPAWP